MIPSGSKYLYGSALLALIGAFFLALATAGHKIGMSSLTGAVTLGYKGPVGDHFGYTVLVAYAGAAFFVGAILTASRDGDPEAGAQLIGLEQPAQVIAPRGASYWPVLASFGVGVTVLGVVFDSYLFVFGSAIVGISALEWTIHAWADGASGDPLVNRKARNRLLNPIEIPLMAIVGIGLFIVAVSRVLLAVDKTAGVIIFGLVPTVVFVVAIILNSRPKAAKNVVASLAVFGAAVILIGGIIGGIHGARTPEEKKPDVHKYKLKGQSMAPLGDQIIVRRADR